MDSILQHHSLQFPKFLDFTVRSSSAPYSEALNISVLDRNSGRTKRPLNAFMLFAKLQRDHLTYSGSVNHSEISRALGKRWRGLSADQKVPFVHGSKLLADWHRQEFPDYKYKPRKRTPAVAGALLERARAPHKTVCCLDGTSRKRRGGGGVSSISRELCSAFDAAKRVKQCGERDTVTLLASGGHLWPTGLSAASGGVVDERSEHLPDRRRRLSSPFSPLSRASLSSGYESDSVSEAAATVTGHLQSTLTSESPTIITTTTATTTSSNSSSSDSSGRLGVNQSVHNLSSNSKTLPVIRNNKNAPLSSVQYLSDLMEVSSSCSSHSPASSSLSLSPPAVSSPVDDWVSDHSTTLLLDVDDDQDEDDHFDRQKSIDCRGLREFCCFSPGPLAGDGSPFRSLTDLNEGDLSPLCHDGILAATPLIFPGLCDLPTVDFNFDDIQL